MIQQQAATAMCKKWYSIRYNPAPLESHQVIIHKCMNIYS